MTEISEENLSLMCRLCLNDKSKLLIKFTDDKYPDLIWKIENLAEIKVNLFLIQNLQILTNSFPLDF